MKLDAKFPELDNLITKMGAQQSSWQLPGPECGELIAELERGIPLSRENLENLVVETRFGRLLSCEGKQVVLYIKDTRLDKSTLLYDIQNAVRFHISDCQTIKAMRVDGRFERYVTATRQDGKFLVEATDSRTHSVEEIEAPLAVCMNCLYELDWRGYGMLNRPKHIWENFSLEGFFAECATFFPYRPQYTDQTAPPGGYARNWDQIATAMKQQRNWRCDNAKCGVNLSDRRYRFLLHAHHRNGVTSDNRPLNIEVLCKLCHSEKPAHGRLRASITEDESSMIEALRRQQRTP